MQSRDFVTLHVRDLVQGFRDVTSITPQWISGLNSRSDGRAKGEEKNICYLHNLGQVVLCKTLTLHKPFPSKIMYGTFCLSCRQHSEMMSASYTLS